MDCKVIEQNMVLLCGNDLDKATTEKMHRHMEECASCKLLYNKMQMAFVAIENEKNQQINPYFTNKLMMKINEAPLAYSYRRTFMNQVVNFALKYTYLVVLIMGVLLGSYIGKMVEIESVNVENIYTEANNNYYEIDSLLYNN